MGSTPKDLGQENEKDIEDIDKEVREKINFIKVSKVSEVLKEALLWK